MPFTMVHLIVADKVSNTLLKQNVTIQDNTSKSFAFFGPQYFLGSISPDAVYNRENFTSDFKKDAHLCADTEKWGMTTNDDAWKGNVICFLREQINSQEKDFVLGYCCHILTDIYNNMAIWTPFKRKYQAEIEKGFGNLYHQESSRVDVELALTYERREFYWENIKKAEGINLPDFIYAEEIEQQKEKILHVWFKDKERPDISSHQEITYESTMVFIEHATEFVVSVFQEFL